MAFLVCHGAFKQWKGPSTGWGHLTCGNREDRALEAKHTCPLTPFESYLCLDSTTFPHLIKRAACVLSSLTRTAWSQLLLTRSVLAMVWKTKKSSNNYGESAKTNLCYWIEAGHGVFYKLHWLSVSNART